MRPALAVRPAGPLPVICMVEHLHRDRAMADAVREGRFTHLNLTLELGHDPDWRSPAPLEDVEWRIEWSKFYYGLDLAHAGTDRVGSHELGALGPAVRVALL